jgi:sugar phosphate isomerase/epimerase
MARMEFGCCVSALDQLPPLEAAGCDYCELAIARMLMASGSERDFGRMIEQVARGRVKPRAYNIFLPPHVPVVGPSVNRQEVEPYVRMALDRVGRLGGGIVVFGSGRSRSVPESFSRAAALDQLVEFLRWTAGIAAGHGIVLTLEPLRRPESNVLNSLRESAALIRDRKLGEVRLLADLYHLMEGGEPFAALDECADLLAHVHVADSDRRPPGLGGYNLPDFFRHLHHVGYGGDCSIECAWTNFPEQIAASLGHVRQAAQAAGW